MANFIQDISAHGVQYDITSDKARTSHYSKVANWCIDDTGSTYHFSATNIGSIPIYDPAGTIVYNENIGVITPKFTNADTIPAFICLKNNVENKNRFSNNSIVVYTAVNTQKNYTNVVGSYYESYDACMSEYQGRFNQSYTSNASVRVPFKFTVCLERKADKGTTPDFESTKPLAKITTIYGEPINNLYVNGPTYIMGTCLGRRYSTASSYAFPNTNYRANVREMFFYINLDSTSNNYGSIYLCPSNCKLGATTASAYHCSYTEAQCSTFRFLELHFNTTLYVMYK